MKHLHQILQQKYQFYHNWHQTKHHNKAHWGALVGFTLIMFALILNSSNQINAQTDNIPPTTPVNLTVAAVSSTQINLSWTASTDDVEVAGYKIYRDGSLITTQNSLLTTYSDTGLQPSTTYTYTVSAYDAAGNESGQSVVVSATTQQQPEGCSSEINNNAFCSPPPLPLPTAGNTFLDPNFETEIIRVTDTNDGENAYVSYSYWNLFNSDSSRFVINIDLLPGVQDNIVYLYNFDKTTDTVTKIGPLFPSGNTNPKLRFEGLIWSAKDPDILYGIKDGSASIYKYNVISKQYTLIKDFSSIWPDTNFSQMSMDENDNTFAFLIRENVTYKKLGVGVYDIAKDAYYRFDTPPGADYIDEGQIDKSGQWVQIELSPQTAGRIVWNLVSDEKTAIADNTVERAPGHYDQGYGKIIGADRWAGQGYTYTLRDNNDPKNYTTVFSGNNWDVGSHISWRNNDNQYAYSSNYTPNKLTDASLENEIIQIFLDGTGRYRRLAHHHSIYSSYYDSPRAAVDRLGKYIIFNSNWDNSGRYDVFILKIPEQFQAPIRVGISDSIPHPRPSQPPTFNSDHKVPDPTFRTTIMRVTGPAGSNAVFENDLETQNIAPVQHFHNPWSYTGKHFIAWMDRLSQDSGARVDLFEIDQINFTVERIRTVASPVAKMNYNRGVHFDYNNEWIVYAVDTSNIPHTIRSWNLDIAESQDGLAPNSNEVIYTDSEGIDQLTISNNDDKFSYYTSNKKVKVWVRSTNTTYTLDVGSWYSFDEAQISDDGKYVLVKGKKTIGDDSTYRYNYDLTGEVAYTKYSPDYFSGKHSGYGNAWVNESSQFPTYRLVKRNLDDAKDLFSWIFVAPSSCGSVGGCGTVHPSFSNANYIYGGFFSTTPYDAAKPYLDEIVRFKDDGSEELRLAHAWSNFFSGSYDEIPAYASPQGDYVIFYSNWNGQTANARHDIFIVSTRDFTSVDITAPSIPANLTAIAVSSSQINLSWSAATDNVGVAGYKIYRDGILRGTIDEGGGTNYSDTGLQPSTTYSYQVSAYDAAGNESPQSTSVSVTTLPTFKQSDLNQDGKTDQLDFDILKQDYNRTDKPPSDLNQDGIVDSRDLGILMGEWSR